MTLAVLTKDWVRKTNQSWGQRGFKVKPLARNFLQKTQKHRNKFVFLFFFWTFPLWGHLMSNLGWFHGFKLLFSRGFTLVQRFNYFIQNREVLRSNYTHTQRLFQFFSYLKFTLNAQYIYLKETLGYYTLYFAKIPWIFQIFVIVCLTYFVQ